MKKFSICLFILLLGLSFAACSDDGDSSANYSVFYDATQDSLPSFDAGTGSRAVTWNWGSPIFEFYSMFADENPGAYFNLYDALETADQRFTDAVNSGSDITEQAIDAPWEVGFNSGDSDLRTYNKLYTYTADGYDSKTYSRINGDNYYMLNWTDIDRNGDKNKSIIQAVYDASTGNIKLGFFMANYVTSSWEIVRCYAEGNTLTSLFSLKILRSATGYSNNVIGYGKAIGESNYFLLKLKNNSTDAPDTYYTFPADSDADELQATMDDAGDGTAQNDTEGYDASLPSPFVLTDLPDQTDVDNMTAPTNSK